MKSSSNKHLHGRVSIDIAIKDEQLQGPAVMRYLARERQRGGAGASSWHRSQISDGKNLSDGTVLK